ncbi:hypothetical protein [Nocardia sp. NBC_01329]|uniref:hypothetical protein n=1 Tax=Nocardia sp. NBC_01329 TaxID=2903594 RepID=UPI002E13C540|nr:hypothetical protein OG405_13835 [Nocardia sp. NBC_01329]
MTTRNCAGCGARIETSGKRGKGMRCWCEADAPDLTSEDWQAIGPWLDPHGWAGGRPMPEMGGA